MSNDTHRLVGDNHYHGGVQLRTGDTFSPSDLELRAYGHKFERLESAEDVTDSDEDNEFDESEMAGAEEFTDRTPMDDVVTDIEAGEADAHLEAVRTAEVEGRDRDGVLGAIDAREESLESEGDEE